jgi:pimeloyl-ACP methyl ester carboxylesterase
VIIHHLITQRITYLLALSLFIISTTSCRAQTVQDIVLDPSDSLSGHYLVVEPETKPIKGVLVLIGGFGNHVDQILPETKLETVAAANGLLTVVFAMGNRLYADSITQQRLSQVFRDVIRRYKVSPNAFVLSGYSAGGTVALRYVELCNEQPSKFPIHPLAVFLVDSPIDIFTLWEHVELSARTRYSRPAYEEADNAMAVMRSDMGVPRENVAAYARVNPFSMNPAYGEPEKALKNTPIRAYHDVDIAWRLVNRNQTVHNSNYEVTAELINRLMLMGNKRAEFMQSFKTGYRANGQRHPHSWSIVNEEECISWIKGLLQDMPSK